MKEEVGNKIRVRPPHGGGELGAGRRRTHDVVVLRFICRSRRRKGKTEVDGGEVAGGIPAERNGVRASSYVPVQSTEEEDTLLAWMQW
jgi:hypothetical protein